MTDLRRLREPLVTPHSESLRIPHDDADVARMDRDREGWPGWNVPAVPFNGSRFIASHSAADGPVDQRVLITRRYPWPRSYPGGAPPDYARVFRAACHCGITLPNARLIGWVLMLSGSVLLDAFHSAMSLRRGITGGPIGSVPAAVGSKLLRKNGNLASSVDVGKVPPDTPAFQP